MARCKKSTDFSGLDDTLGKLIAAQIDFGKEALKLINDGGKALVDSINNMNLPAGSSCCDIPDPCWMPLDLGQICCQICSGDQGEICFIIGNEDFRAQDYRVFAAGEHASLVTVSQSQFRLGPKERQVVSVKFEMPDREQDTNQSNSCCECNDYEAIIWVTGCRNHFLRWYINHDKKQQKCCHEVYVNDIPDYELHWYDHFHYPRPCLGSQTSPEQKGGG